MNECQGVLIAGVQIQLVVVGPRAIIICAMGLVRFWSWLEHSWQRQGGGILIPEDVHVSSIVVYSNVLLLRCLFGRMKGMEKSTGLACCCISLEWK